MTSFNSTFCFCVVVVPNKLLLLAQLTSHSGLCPGAHLPCGIAPHAFVTSLLAHDTGASPPSRLGNGHHDIRIELGSIWQQDNTRACRAIWQERRWGRRREGRAARREVLATCFLMLWCPPKTDGGRQSLCLHHLGTDNALENAWSFAVGCLQQSVFFSPCTFFPVGSSALCPGLLNRPSSPHLSSELKRVHFQMPWTDLMKVPKRNRLEFSRTISLWKRKLQATKGATRAKAHDTKP